MLTTDTQMDQADDAILVGAVQGGDVQVFEALVDRHLDFVHAFISLKLPVPHLVDEITHETFVFAYRHLHQFTVGTAFRAWLRAIAANKIRAEIERYCREERNLLAYAERRLIELSADEYDVQDSHAIEALNECMKRVPEHARALLTLRYHDEDSTEEIAQRLERSLAWVRTSLCRLRQQLKECVEAKLRANPL